MASDTPRPAMNDTPADPVRLALDALWADLPYLMGRASAEGHEAGQALAGQWRAKIEAAIKEADDA